MGIYSQPEKIQIIKTNPNRVLLDAARSQAKKLRMHITGDGLKEAIEAMPYFESKAVTALRKTYCRSNKDLFARIFYNRDKVFTARGGSKTFDMPKSEEANFRAYLSEIMYGLPLDKWIKTTALQA